MIVLTSKNKRKIILVVGILILILLSTLPLKIPDFLRSSYNETLFKSKAERFASLCQGKKDWRTCYGGHLAALNKSQNFEKTLTVLWTLQDLDSKTRDCHFIAHRLTASEVEKDVNQWLDIFKYVDNTVCANGFIHGAIEGKVKFDPSFKLNAQTISDVCNQIEERLMNKKDGKSDQVDDACAHGIGHILLVETEGNIAKATAICEQIPDIDLQYTCYHGVFMENIIRDNLENHGISKKFRLTLAAANGLEKVCLKYSGSAKKGCWREMAHIYTTLSEHNPTKNYDFCTHATAQTDIDECYFHSINLMILSDKLDTRRLGDICIHYLNNKAKLPLCINRTLTPLLVSSTKFTDRAISFCISLPEDPQKSCFTEIGDTLKKLTSIEERRSLCSSAPIQFKDLCIGP